MRSFGGFALTVLTGGCTHASRTDELELRVKRLEAKLGEMESDWGLFLATPDGRWLYPKPSARGDKKNAREKKR